jgi:hypothetical protein
MSFSQKFAIFVVKNALIEAIFGLKLPNFFVKILQVSEKARKTHPNLKFEKSQFPKLAKISAKTVFHRALTTMYPQNLKQSGNVYLPGTAVAPKSADGSKFRTLGTAKFQVCHKNISTNTEVFIIEGLEKPILSCDALQVFKLIPANFPFAEVNEVNNEPVPKPVQVLH